MAQRFKWKLSSYRIVSMIVFSILSLIRFHNLCLGAAAVLIATKLLNMAIIPAVYSCIFIVISAMALGYIFNDILDIKSDSVNHPSRPLVKGTISKSSINIIIFFFIVLLCFAMQTIHEYAIYFLFLYVFPSLLLYNYFLQKTPLLGNILVSSLLGSIFLFTELVLLQTYYKLLIPFFLTFSITFLRELLKDLEDYDGDLMVNMQTAPIVLGYKKIRHTLIILYMLLIIGLPTPYFFTYYTINYLILLIIFIEIPLIYSLFLLIKFPSKRTYKRLVRILKALCGLGLIILMLGGN